jgi:TPP-dependent pyruvate/acetoin dehydrogenase alpha subunit
MKTKWTKNKLIKFENKVAKLFKQGKINAPIHLSGGNECQLIEIFKKINKEDYVFSTHRSHFHYLLKGGSPERLLDEILGKTTGICGGCGRSLHLFDSDINFYTSAIVGGICGMAVGTALAIKKQGKKNYVWAFIGDGATDTGLFKVSASYAEDNELPLTFIIEDNDRAVDTTKSERGIYSRYIDGNYIGYYSYERKWPHVCIGQHVSM